MAKRSTADYNRQVGWRLRVTACELGYDTEEAFAAAVGATRGAVDAWFNGRALPPVTYLHSLIPLGVTLDWIFLGDRSGLPRSMDIRLQGALAGMAVPHVTPEPDPPLSPEAARAAAGETPKRAASRRFSSKRTKRANAN
jgi:hypothetical protein